MKFFELIDAKTINSQLNAIAIFKSALSLSLFDRLVESPLTISELAEQTGTVQSNLVQIVDCLIVLGFLQSKNNEKIELTKTWRNKYLDKNTFSESALIKGCIQSQERWEKISDIAKGISTNHENEMFSSGVNLKSYLLSVMETNRDHASALAKEIVEEMKINDYCNIADIAGGHGLYLFSVMSLYSEIKPTLMDLDKTLTIFNQINKNNPELNKVKQKVIDLRQPINSDEKYDFVMLNDLLHSFNYEDKKQVIRRIKDLLCPKGTLMISKFDHQSRAMKVDMTLFSMHLMVNSSSGYLEKNEELESILSECEMEIYKTVKLGNKISYFTKMKDKR